MANENQQLDVIGPIVREAARRPYVLVLCFVASSLLAWYIYSSARPVYSTSFRVRYAELKTNSPNVQSILPLDEGAQLSWDFNSQPYVIKSSGVLVGALTRAGVLPANHDPEKAEELSKAYAARLGVTLVPSTNVIDVSYSSGDRQDALVFAQAVLESYIEYDKYALNIDESNAAKALEDRLDKLANQRAQIEQDLLTAKAATDAHTAHQSMLGRIEEDAAVVWRALKVSDRELREKTIEHASALAALRARWDETLSSYGKQHPEFTRVLLEQRLIEEMLKLESHSDLAAFAGNVDAAVYGSYSRFLAARSQHEENLRHRDFVISGSGGRLVAADFVLEKFGPPAPSRTALDDEIGSMSLSSADVASLQAQLQRIIVDMSTARNAIDEKTPFLTGDLVRGRIQRLDKPGSASVRSSTSREFALAIAALGGTLLSIASFGLISARRRGFRSLEEMEEAIPEGVLSLLPFIKDAVPGPMLLEKGRRPAWDDRFRQLAYRLVTVFGNDQKFRITVCSALPSEGKTTVAANIAVTLGRAGRRVLIVDGNLRRPSCCLTLGVKPDNTGFFHLLTGEAQLEDAIYPCRHENVFVVPPGNRVDDSTDYLTRAPLEPLFDAMSEQYDVVIVDTPPALLVADAMVTAHATDGLVLVHAVGTSSRADLLRVLRQAREADIPIVGVVANQRSRATFAAPRQDFGYVSSAASLYGSGGTGVQELDSDLEQVSSRPEQRS